jgi:uncharacterized protein (UPF0276 family)
MLELACNYSPQLLDLLVNGEASVDWIKLSRRDTMEEEIKLCRPLKPLLLHTLPHASMDTTRIREWQDVNDQIKRCSSPHAALHLTAAPSDFPESEPRDEGVVERLLRSVLIWKQFIQCELLVENVPFYGFRGSLRPACEPEVISYICEQADVGILLDTAHLRVAAHHMGMDAADYLHRLPLERIREIHVSGPGPDPEQGYLKDRHLEMQEIDYELLERVLTVTKPRFVTLEYGGTGPMFEWRSEPDVLRRQLVKLREIVTRFS